MKSDAAFLDAIAAAPADRWLCLVYADWLEDQGDERAELIRLYEEMRTLEPWSDAFWQRRKRRDALRRTVSPEWLARMRYGYRPLFTRYPTDRASRWRLMEEFVETWFGPLPEATTPVDATLEEIAAAEKRLGLALPEALRQWYLRIGRTLSQWAPHAYWHGLSALRLNTNERLLPIYRGMHGGLESGIRYGDLESGTPDPPVFRMQGGREANSFTEFAQLRLLLEAPWHAFRRGRTGSTRDRGAQKEITSRTVRAALRDDFVRKIGFREGDDLLVIVGESPRMVYGRTRHAFDQFNLNTRHQLNRHT